MPTSSLRQRLVLTSIFMIILAVAMIVFIIMPTVKEIFSLQKNIADVQDYFEQQYDQTKLLKKSIANLPAITTRVNTYRGATISHGAELDIITALESLADSNHLQQNLTIESPDELAQTIDKKSPRAQIRLPFVAFSITNQGSFANQLRYLRALEHLPYYVFIDTIEWQKPRGNTNAPDSGIIAVHFNAAIYENAKK